MTKIKILDQNTASKIAAGEVIERPAGVLKELLENSLDSGASVINVDIENAGKKLIRVNDNGSGISEDDLSLALLRHSTSKINNFEDLNNLNTFGFRGEALFSVAAISEISVSSCIEGAKTGSKIISSGGSAITQIPAPAIKGTTVDVKNLFFNTPARLKFLKSDTVERSHLLRCCEEAALANPKASFNIKTDGVPVYALPAREGSEQGLRSRLGKIFGEELAESLVYAEDESFAFKAFVSPIDKLTAARDRQFFFINKRPVGSKLLQQAVYKAYQQYRAKDKFPAVVLYMELNPASFDVNIHPQKRDIKFVNENEIFSFIYKKISAVLLGTAQTAGLNAAAAFGITKEPCLNPLPQNQNGFTEADIPMPQNSEALFSTLRSPSVLQVQDFEEPKAYSVNPQQEEVISQSSDSGFRYENLSKPKQELIEEYTQNPAWWRGPYTYLGQVHQSYLVFENGDGMVLVDQHAAQERVLFENYLEALERKAVKTQPLMFPVNIDLPASDIEGILAWTDFLAESGFDIARFSAGTILVNTVPAILKLSDEGIKDFIIKFAAVIGDPAKTSETVKHNMIATMACKKAIKAGEKLEGRQADALMQNLKKCKDGLHCPHGRPTLISLGVKEIAKQFGRT